MSRSLKHANWPRILIGIVAALGCSNMAIAQQAPDPPVGRFLLVASEGLYVVESDGNCSWSYQPTPYEGQGWVEYDDLIYDGCRLPNGNYLIAAHRYVREIDSAKRTIWEYRVPGRTEVKTCVPLSDHGVAVLNSAEQAILELESGTARVLHRIPVPARGTDHTRYNMLRWTDSGTYLVALRGESRFVEVDRYGREILSLPMPSLPVMADRLANGNTVCSGRFGLKEFDATGKETWSFTPDDAGPHFRLIYAAGFVPLPGQQLLVCNSDWHYQTEGDNRVQLFAVDRDKRLRWTLPATVFAGWKKSEVEPRTGFTEHRCAVIQPLP